MGTMSTVTGNVGSRGGKQKGGGCRGARKRRTSDPNELTRPKEDEGERD